MSSYDLPLYDEKILTSICTQQARRWYFDQGVAVPSTHHDPGFDQPIRLAFYLHLQNPSKKYRILDNDASGMCLIFSIACAFTGNNYNTETTKRLAEAILDDLRGVIGVCVERKTWRAVNLYRDYRSWTDVVKRSLEKRGRTRYESAARSLDSEALQYFSDDGDFDGVYNEKLVDGLKRWLSYGLGSNIPGKDWPEDGQIVTLLCECLSGVKIVTLKENNNWPCLTCTGDEDSLRSESTEKVWILNVTSNPKCDHWMGLVEVKSSKK